MWTYLAGFRPQAYGTEKFMDYGFMEAMMRSTVRFRQKICGIRKELSITITVVSISRYFSRRLQAAGLS